MSALRDCEDCEHFVSALRDCEDCEHFEGL